MTSSDEFFKRLQGHAPDQHCIEVGEHAYTYADLMQEMQHWHLRFDQWSVSSGMVVGLRADYSFLSVSALLSLVQRRAIVALVPRDGELGNRLRESQAAALLDITTESNYEWHSIPCSREHVLLDDLRAAGNAGLIIFSSGSTASPKAALLSFERFLYKFCKPGRRFRTIAFLLFDHVGGLDTLFYTLSSGGTLIVTRRRDPDFVLNLIESHKAEVLPTSSSFLRMCIGRAKFTNDLSSLKVITYGSEPMDPITLERLNDRFRNVQICQKYGTTETGSPRTVSRANDSLWLKFKSGDVDTRIVDGILWIRTEGTMLGYLNAPSQIDGQGWYCTGDLVEVDGEWIRFLGRASDVINVGGEKVSPVEVEQVILQLTLVQEVVVIGEAHVLLGQVVVARVKLRAHDLHVKEAAKRIRLHCQTHLPRYKVPMKVTIVDELVIDPRHKLRRRPVPHQDGLP